MMRLRTGRTLVFEQYREFSRKHRYVPNAHDDKGFRFLWDYPGELKMIVRKHDRVLRPNDLVPFGGQMTPGSHGAMERIGFLTTATLIFLMLYFGSKDYEFLIHAHTHENSPIPDSSMIDLSYDADWLHPSMRSTFRKYFLSSYTDVFTTEKSYYFPMAAARSLYAAAPPPHVHLYNSPLSCPCSTFSARIVMRWEFHIHSAWAIISAASSH